MSIATDHRVIAGVSPLYLRPAGGATCSSKTMWVEVEEPLDVLHADSATPRWG